MHDGRGKRSDHKYYESVCTLEYENIVQYITDQFQGNSMTRN